MSAPFALRPAVRADLPDIVRLTRGLAEYEHLAHEFTATEATFERLLFSADRLAEAVLADIPGQPPVGIALFIRIVHTFRGYVGLFLEDLFVEPAHRGRGIGKALLRHLAVTATERGYHWVEWSVLDWNEPSIQFYEKLGATRVEGWHTRRLTGEALTALALAALAKGASTHG